MVPRLFSVELEVKRGMIIERMRYENLILECITRHRALEFVIVEIR